jgi:hypothetical protein
MTSYRNIWFLGVGIWCAAMACGQQSPAKTIPHNTIVLPPVGLATSETAQINIMGTAANYPGWSFVTTCQASVTFYGPDGSTLGSPTSFILGKTPQIFSVVLPYASVGAKTSPMALSAQIALTPAASVFSVLSPPIPACVSAFTLETYDTVTGVAHVLLEGQAGQGPTILGAVSVLPCLAGDSDCELMYYFEFTPSQIITLPPVGLSATETAQVDIRNSAAGYDGSSAASCNVSVQFYGADGSALSAPATFVLGRETPRKVFSAQLPYASTGTGISRTAISAQISLTAIPITTSYPASAIPPCVIAFSLKTYDTATGVTHSYVTGQSASDAASASTAGAASTRSYDPRQ